MKLSIHTNYNDVAEYWPHIFFQNGFTPLHIAAKYGNQNVAGVLIQHGATIDYKTKVQYCVDIDCPDYCCYMYVS